MDKLVQDVGTFVPDKLIAGTESSFRVEGIVVKKGQNVLQRGTVMGKITATGACAVVDNSKSDGSEKPYCILTDTIDSGDGTGDDVPTTAYLTGVFNRHALIFGGDDTADDHKDELRKLGIFLEDVH